MSHTPGKWRITEAKSGFPVIESETAKTTFDKPRQIALVYQGLIDSESEANARLIASAPELLGALKMAIAWLKNTQAREDRAPKGLCEYNPMGELEQAIAKAEKGE